MTQEILEKEVNEYNELIKELQDLNQQVTAKEQERLLKLGRVQFIQEEVSKMKAKAEAKPDKKETRGK